MYQMAKQPMRLGCLNALPTAQTVVQVLQTLQSNSDRTILLQWVVEDSDGFTLAVIAETRQPLRPLWYLYAGLETVGDPLWKQQTEDIDMVLQIVLLQVESEQTKKNPHRSNQNLNALRNTEEQRRLNTMLSSEAPAAPTGAVVQSAAGVNLSGELAEVDLTSVLQSITLCKMTGQLEVTDKLKGATVNFEDGALLHAAFLENTLTQDKPSLEGDGVILELLTWPTGTFCFHHAMKTSSRTVTRRLEGLLMEGAALSDYARALSRAGFDMHIKLSAANPSLSDSDLDELTKDGIPLDKALQRKVFDAIRFGCSMDQILMKMSLPKPVWVPIIFNLHNAKLITFGGEVQPTSTTTTDMVQIDRAAAMAAFREFLRPETGIMSYQLFVYFVLKEISRFEKTGVPFSIAILNIYKKKDGRKEPLTSLEVRYLATHIEKYLDEDLVQIAHYRDLDFALLLPCMDSEVAFAAVDRFISWLRFPIEGFAEDTELDVRYGMASVPESTVEPEVLLAVASQTKPYQPA